MGQSFDRYGNFILTVHCQKFKEIFGKQQDKHSRRIGIRSRIIEEESFLDDGGQIMILPDFLTQDPDGFIRLTGHRIGLQHMIHYYNLGYSPEMLVCEYPTISLALTHKNIAFYLENRTEVDNYIDKCEKEIEQQRVDASEGPGMTELRRRLEKTQHVENL